MEGAVRFDGLIATLRPTARNAQGRPGACAPAPGGGKIPVGDRIDCWMREVSFSSNNQ
jgi:hypothetical protein